MSIAVLLFAVLATAIVVWLVQQGHIPAPFVWIVYAVLIVVWVVVLLDLLGIGGLNLGRVD